MTASKRGPARVETGPMTAQHGSGSAEVAGLLPLVAALALWVVALAGIAAPLGDALSKLDRGRGAAPANAEERRDGAAVVACAVPAHALASAAWPSPAGECP